MKIQNNKSEQKGIKRDRPQREKGPTPTEKGTDPNMKRKVKSNEKKNNKNSNSNNFNDSNYNSNNNC